MTFSHIFSSDSCRVKFISYSITIVALNYDLQFIQKPKYPHYKSTLEHKNYNPAFSRISVQPTDHGQPELLDESELHVPERRPEQQAHNEHQCSPALDEFIVAQLAAAAAAPPSPPKGALAGDGLQQRRES